MSTAAIVVRLLAVGLSCCAPIAAAQAPSPGQPVRPGQRFPSALLDVRAPDSEGWLLAGSARNGMSFARQGTADQETYGAQAFLFEMPPTNTDEALVRFVRERIATVNPAPRFRETDAGYRYTEERGYPCVAARVELDDTSITTSAGPLALQVVALYCRHPERKTVGFSAVYSRRGAARTDDWRDAAKRYVDGVVVPSP